MITDFYEKVEKIIEKDARYKLDAYSFVMQALWFIQKKLGKQGHISGKELLEGIRELGIEQYGPMTKVVFNHWGVKKTDDFGQIVFNMVDCGLMNKTDEDTPENFKDVYDFDAALNVFNAKEKD